MFLSPYSQSIFRSLQAPHIKSISTRSPQRASGLLGISMLIGLTGCSSQQHQASQTTDKTPANQTAAEKVVINQAFENLLYICLYVAKDGGFFKEEGLDVDIQTGGGDAQAFAALTSGKADFAQGDPAFVAISSEKGWNGKILGMVVDRAALWGVSLKKTIKPFSDPAGFRNLTVATFPEPNTSYVIQKQLDQRAHLILGKDTKILQMVYGTEAAALKNGQADIAQMLEPNVSLMEKEGASVVFSYPEVWGPIAFTGITASEKTVQEKPEMVQKFVNAYEKALHYVHTDLDGTADIAAKRFPNIPRPILKQALTRAMKAKVFPEHLTVDKTAWQKLLQIRIEIGDLKKMPDDRKLIDNSFAEKAVVEQSK